MKKYKAPLFFVLKLLPVTLAATFFMLRYQLELLSGEMIETLLSQAGSIPVLMAVGMVQTAVIVSLAGFFGCVLSGKLGLWKEFHFEKDRLPKPLFLSVLCGVLFSLDYWAFGAVIPGVREAALSGMTVNGVLASVLYGGIIEEILMRLFFLSFVAWILRMLFARKQETVPAWIFVTANVAAALLFAAGHLPATAGIFGSLTPMLVLRCFLLNGGFGIVFGRLYRSYGIHYAMLGHAVCHIVSKLIWLLFA